MSAYLITTERLGLREWIAEDVKPFAEMNMDKEVMKYFPSLISEDETLKMLERIKLSFDKNKFGLYAVEKKSTHEFIGYTGFAKPVFESFFTPCIEIGWRFKKEEWNNGYATEAANACLKYGFEVLDFDKVFSFTSLINVNSEKVMIKIGMTRVGEFDHPKIEPSSVLCRHVLYRIDKPG